MLLIMSSNKPKNKAPKQRTKLPFTDADVWELRTRRLRDYVEQLHRTLAKRKSEMQYHRARKNEVICRLKGKVEHLATLLAKQQESPKIAKTLWPKFWGIGSPEHSTRCTNFWVKYRSLGSAFFVNPSYATLDRIHSVLQHLESEKLTIDETGRLTLSNAVPGAEHCVRTCIIDEDGATFSDTVGSTEVRRWVLY